jgi:hypothetical protein
MPAAAARVIRKAVTQYAFIRVMQYAVLAVAGSIKAAVASLLHLLQ